jgi:hypothetical protein
MVKQCTTNDNLEDLQVSVINIKKQENSTIKFQRHNYSSPIKGEHKEFGEKQEHTVTIYSLRVQIANHYV